MDTRNRRQNTLALALVLVSLAGLWLSTSVGAQNPPGRPRQAQPSPQPTKASPSPQSSPSAKPSPAPPEDDSDMEVVRITSNLVRVPVSVTDATGNPVLGLTTTDFRLEEEGRPQEIAQIGDPEQVPLEIALLIDVSGSVDARIDFEKEAAARFLKQVLKPIDRATVYAIDQKPRLELARATADSAAARLVAIAPAKGPTAFYDSIIEAARYLGENSPPQHRRVIVVISDGEDNFSARIRDAELAEYRRQVNPGNGNDRQANLASAKDILNRLHRQALLDVQREVQSAEVAFYSINPSGEANRLNVPGLRAQKGMEQLAEVTGGNSFIPEKLENLDAVFRQIAAELRSQYLLQYYSNDESPNGKYLTIKVRVPARPQLRVRARQGYYVKRK